MEINLKLKENCIYILNEEDKDVIYNFYIFGDEELLYGKDNNIQPKNSNMWHKPKINLMLFQNIKIILDIHKNSGINRVDIDPYGEENWEEFDRVEKCWKLETKVITV